MKDCLRILVNEFLEQTRADRTKSVEVQHTNHSKKRMETITAPPTFQDFVEWLDSESCNSWL